jgi:pyocin large subunit-like protein
MGGRGKTSATQNGNAQNNSASALLLGFNNPAALFDHFNRHGKQFGTVDATDYNMMAIKFKENKAKNIDSIKSNNGEIKRYQASTNTFISLRSDGTIKTFFKPRTGIRYWESEKNKWKL